MSAVPDAVYLVKRLINIHPERVREALERCREKSGRSAAAIVADMLWCGLRYGAGPVDYSYCEFYNVPEKNRATYVTRGVNNDLVRRLNDPSRSYIFEDKAEFARRFSRFMHRRWIDVDRADTREFNALLESGAAIFAKPRCGTGGRGVERIELCGFSGGAQLGRYLRRRGFGVAEQEAAQCPEMSALNPGSVNTVRMVTVVSGSGPRLVFAALRAGNGAAVDNLHSGGMAAIVDIKSGVVITAAVDKAYRLYERHPATNAMIKGFEIPMWRRCEETVLAAARVVPEVGYVGWDVCIAPGGPLLIEGNCFPGHDIYQMPHIMAPEYMGALPGIKKALAG